MTEILNEQTFRTEEHVPQGLMRLGLFIFPTQISKLHLVSFIYYLFTSVLIGLFIQRECPRFGPLQFSI